MTRQEGSTTYLSAYSMGLDSETCSDRITIEPTQDGERLCGFGEAGSDGYRMLLELEATTIDVGGIARQGLKGRWQEAKGDHVAYQGPVQFVVEGDTLFGVWAGAGEELEGTAGAWVLQAIGRQL